MEKLKPTSEDTIDKSQKMFISKLGAIFGSQNFVEKFEDEQKRKADDLKSFLSRYVDPVVKKLHF